MEGIVVSDKMQKTATVSVERFKNHKVYKKQFKINKNYKVHDEENQCSRGDKVSIIECRPISKDKKFKLLKIIEKGREENILKKPAKKNEPATSESAEIKNDSTDDTQKETNINTEAAT